MVLAGLDPKTGKKPVSADVSGNDAVDGDCRRGSGQRQQCGGRGKETARARPAQPQLAVTTPHRMQRTRKLQMVRKLQRTRKPQKDAQAAEDAAAKTPALSKEEIAQLDPTTGVQATVRPWLQDFTATWVKGHISYGPEEIRAQIQAVYDAGYEEWILWNATNRYTEGGLLTQEEEEQ